MGHGTLPSQNRPGQRPKERPQRLGQGTRKAQVCSGFAFERHTGELGDDEDCKWIARISLLKVLS